MQEISMLLVVAGNSMTASLSNILLQHFVGVCSPSLRASVGPNFSIDLQVNQHDGSKHRCSRAQSFHACLALTEKSVVQRLLML
jgi:hypothetical protein